jgi:alanine-synthesizing transaminase
LQARPAKLHLSYHDIYDAAKRSLLPEPVILYHRAMFARRTGWNLAKNRFTEALERHHQSGRACLDLSASNPPRVGLQPPLQPLLQAFMNPASLDYDPQPRGLLSARQAVARYYADLGAPIDPEHLLLTTSTSEGYSFTFRLLCDPGDEVLVPEPSYPLFEFLADIQDVRLVPYELVYDHGWQIDFHSLEKSISPRSRAVILVNPNNPTGSYVHAAEREQLNALCAARELALIVDEVFFDFPLAVDRPITFARNESALTFTLSGLSKIAGLPQMKVAWIATTGPDAVAQPALERLEVIADTYLSMNAPIQHAIPDLLQHGAQFRARLSERLCANLAELDRQLQQPKLCSRLQVEGGWYAILRVPVTQSDEALAIALLEQKDVLVHPGHFFNFHSDGYLILSLMTPNEIFADGVRRVLAFITSACAP